jgi:hypothetical protein
MSCGQQCTVEVYHHVLGASCLLAGLAAGLTRLPSSIGSCGGLAKVSTVCVMQQQCVLAVYDVHSIQSLVLPGLASSGAATGCAVAAVSLQWLQPAVNWKLALCFWHA